MVQGSPRIHHVPASNAAQVVAIEYVASLDAPAVCAREVTSLHLTRRLDAVKIVVERMNPGCLQANRRGGKQTATTADIQKSLVANTVDTEQGHERLTRCSKALLVDLAH